MRYYGFPYSATVEIAKSTKWQHATSGAYVQFILHPGSSNPIYKCKKNAHTRLKSTQQSKSYWSNKNDHAD